MMAMKASPSNHDECAGPRNGKERSIDRLPVRSRVAVARLSCTLDSRQAAKGSTFKGTLHRGKVRSCLPGCDTRHPLVVDLMPYPRTTALTYSSSRLARSPLTLAPAVVTLGSCISDDLASFARRGDPRECEPSMNLSPVIGNHPTRDRKQSGRRTRGRTSAGSAWNNPHPGERSGSMGRYGKSA